MNPLLSAGYCIMRHCNFNSSPDADDCVVLMAISVMIRLLECDCLHHHLALKMEYIPPKYWYLSTYKASHIP
jgi:hypothetical protein